MNLSGASVRAFAEYHRLDPGDILVVHDDLDLPVGRIKMARGGGAGGHKGVQSVIHHLGTDRFCRAKIGIGRPRHGEAVETYVLRPFYGDEKDIMDRVTELAVRACELLVSQGVEAAMNDVNCQHLGDKEEMSLCRD
jgi:PTH1 family peptidyl-tRNA hydrolase